MLESDAYMAVACLAFIVGDYATGFFKAACKNDISSTKLREGLYHKLGFIGALVLAYGCQIVTNWGYMPQSFNVVFAGVAVYILIVEAVSIFENLCEISPELAKSPLASLLQVNGKGNDDEQR